MPRGIFLIVHDEIKGPIIKYSYFKIPIELSQEFISKLYMSHAGFDSSAFLELKFNHYKIFSCFTGNLARINRKESILGLIFDEDETFDNLQLFLKRTLNNGVMKNGNEGIKDIFQTKLRNYLELNSYFDTMKIENVSEILLIKGSDDYSSCLLNLGDKKLSSIEIRALYHKMVNEKQISNVKYIQLNLSKQENYYLVFVLERNFKYIDKLLLGLSQYLEEYLEYTLEILAMFLLSNKITLIPFKVNSKTKKFDGNHNLKEILQKSKNYGEKFDELLISIIKNELFLYPIIT